ncbi:endopeptidase La [Mesorhizobium xinjiangense]|uniref:endopeptidase La n=1 Tax=Mesorhizobium xinjiangense TaxID=2678685 RepID=UPI0012ED9F0D|nr:endopeptidase La [Mesorhizobium xinjiangense]
MPDFETSPADQRDTQRPILIPEDAVPIVPVRSTVLFPGTLAPMTLSALSSVAAAQQAVREQRQIGILLQQDPELGEAGPNDLYRFGTVANVIRYLSGPHDTHHVVCQGVQRMRVLDFIPGTPFLTARVLEIPEPVSISPEIEARFLNLRQLSVEAASLLPQAPQELIVALESTESPGALADLAASVMDIKPKEKQEILESVDLVARMDKVARLLSERIEVLRLSNKIGRETKATFDERHRKAILREQMATIQRELGEEDGKGQEVAELGDAIAKASMPEEASNQALKELRRYERMPEGAAEAGMVRNYLDWLIDMPWDLPAEAEIDIAEARRILDEDHYGLEKIKSRIVEYLAVRKLAPEGKAPILCFAGPPGVGKTSLGQSIARAMARPFVRVSLGGVHDEAEVRGHRRTYIGALPGNIIQAVKKAGARNCVMMLDEIDKLGRGIQGDPSAAMLEVLDPEQNGTFRDNYLGVPFDLSRVVFLATANLLDTVPGPLLDRMEVISLPGYTEEEKLQIARRYLVRRQLQANGLTSNQVGIDDEALRLIINGYTREAGVRSLEREIGKTLRNVAVRIAEGSASEARLTTKDIGAVLGQPRFESEVAMRTSVPGVATGLAWTPVGGDILFIEATRTPGKGALILTGQLGEVMRESAQAAMTLLKTRCSELGIDDSILEGSDIHIHVPAGATPKDGPSAGVAMFTALASLVTGRNVRSDTAMTGEISLRGLVLPVGGIKEKVVAAAAAGLTRVMLPARNRRDYDDIPAGARDKLEFVWLERVDDAIAAALEEGKATPTPATRGATEVDHAPPATVAARGAR